MDKTKSFYKRMLRPRKRETLHEQKKPLINSAVGDNQRDCGDWCAVRFTHQKKEPPLIDHKKVFEK